VGLPVLLQRVVGGALVDRGRWSLGAVGTTFWKQLCLEHGIQSDGTLREDAVEGLDRKDTFFYQADDSHFIPRAVLLDLEPRVRRGARAHAHGTCPCRPCWVRVQVLNEIKASPERKLYNPDNFYCFKDGGGAGKSWVRRSAVALADPVLPRQQLGQRLRSRPKGARPSHGHPRPRGGEQRQLGGWFRASGVSVCMLVCLLVTLCVCVRGGGGGGGTTAPHPRRLGGQTLILVHSIAGGTGSGLGSYLLEQLSDRYPKKLVGWHRAKRCDVSVG
jgi:hypothetical protein